MTRRQLLAAGLGVGSWAGLAWYAGRNQSKGSNLLLASYDATRELYRTINQRFLDANGVKVRPSHGGSSKQALAVREGLPADVVSLAVWPDMNELLKAGLLNPLWESQYPNQSSPFTSTIVFVVRKGNPLDIRDWSDLTARPGVRIIAANPKIGGAARLTYLAAWGATKLAKNDIAADEFVQELFNPVRMPTLESSSRSATQTFVRKGLGDVHLTWESEALLEMREVGDRVEVVRPPRSIRAEPKVAVVEFNVRRHDTESLANDYIQYLFAEASQRLMADLGFRPFHPSIPALPAMNLFQLNSVLPGGWAESQERFFDDGGLFDRSYR